MTTNGNIANEHLRKLVQNLNSAKKVNQSLTRRLRESNKERDALRNFAIEVSKDKSVDSRTIKRAKLVLNETFDNEALLPDDENSR